MTIRSGTTSRAGLFSTGLTGLAAAELPRKATSTMHTNASSPRDGPREIMGIDLTHDDAITAVAGEVTFRKQRVAHEEQPAAGAGSTTSADTQRSPRKSGSHVWQDPVQFGLMNLALALPESSKPGDTNSAMIITAATTVIRDVSFMLSPLFPVSCLDLDDEITPPPPQFLSIGRASFSNPFGQTSPVLPLCRFGCVL